MMMSGSRLVVVVVTLLVGCGRCNKWNKNMIQNQNMGGRERYMRRLGAFRRPFIHGYEVLVDNGTHYINLSYGVKLRVKMDAVMKRFSVEGKQHLDNAVACLVEGKTDCFHIFERMEDYILVDGMFRIYQKSQNSAGFNGLSDGVLLGKYDYQAISVAMGSPLSILNVTDELSEARFPKESLRRGSNKSAKLPAGSLTSGSSVGSKSPNAFKQTAILDNGVTSTKVNNEYLNLDLVHMEFFIHGYYVQDNSITLFRGGQQFPVNAEKAHQECKAMIGQRLTKVITCVLENNCVGFHTYFIKKDGTQMVIDGMYNLTFESDFIFVPGYAFFDADSITVDGITKSTVNQIFTEVKFLGKRLRNGSVFLTVNADADIFTYFI